MAGLSVTCKQTGKSAKKKIQKSFKIEAKKNDSTLYLYNQCVYQMEMTF